MSMRRRPMPIGKPGRMPGPGGITPQQKIMSVVDRLGLPGVENMQGTTVIKYDTLPLDGRTTYEFFANAQTRPFPFSNCGSDGNKLGVGEVLTVQRYTLALVVTAGSPEKIQSITPIAKTTVGVIDGQMSLLIANSQVMKDVPIVQSLPEFNKDAENQVNVSYEFDTYLVIPPELEYIFTLRCSGVTTANTYLRLTIEGVGSLFSPRQTM